MTLPAPVYKQVLGVVLLFAAYRLFLSPGAGADAAPRRMPIPLAIAIGCAIGLLSGLTGVGGGIFLSPLLLVGRWADSQADGGNLRGLHLGQFGFGAPGSARERPPASSRGGALGRRGRDGRRDRSGLRKPASGGSDSAPPSRGRSRRRRIQNAPDLTAQVNRERPVSGQSVAVSPVPFRSSAAASPAQLAKGRPAQERRRTGRASPDRAWSPDDKEQHSASRALQTPGAS